MRPSAGAHAGSARQRPGPPDTGRGAEPPAAMRCWQSPPAVGDSRAVPVPARSAAPETGHQHLGHQHLGHQHLGHQHPWPRPHGESSHEQPFMITSVRGSFQAAGNPGLKCCCAGCRRGYCCRRGCCCGRAAGVGRSLAVSAPAGGVGASWRCRRRLAPGGAGWRRRRCRRGLAAGGAGGGCGAGWRWAAAGGWLARAAAGGGAAAGGAGWRRAAQAGGWRPRLAAQAGACGAGWRLAVFPDDPAAPRTVIRRDRTRPAGGIFG